MHRARLFALVVLALAPAPVHALRMEHFFGTLTVEIFPIPALTVSGEGIATLDEAGVPHVSLDVPGSAVAGHAAAVVASQTPLGSWTWPVPSLHPIAEARLSLRNGTGQLADGRGTMPLRGLYRACLWGDCAHSLANVQVPLTLGGTRGAGIGGFFTRHVVTAGMYATVVGAPWTTGTVSVTTVFGDRRTRRGSVHAPDGGTSFAAAARHGGQIQMVTPLAIYLGDRGRPLYRFSGVATFTAVFAPEPGTAALLGAGVAVLGVKGRQRRARR